VALISLSVGGKLREFLQPPKTQGGCDLGHGKRWGKPVFPLIFERT